jgi:hypothetical protein
MLIEAFAKLDSKKGSNKSQGIGIKSSRDTI